MTSLQLPPIRLFIIDDHMIVRAGLEMLTTQHPEFTLTGQAGNRAQALAVEAKCDVILLDLCLGSDDGLELIPELLQRHPAAKILILTGSRNPEISRSAIAAGAMGVVLKDHSPDVLLKAIRCVHRGEFWMDRSLTASVISGLRRGGNEPINPEQIKIAALTTRECEVIALIGKGLKNKDIAARLFLSETTVRHHLTSIFSKLEVSDRLELLIYAYLHKLV